MPRPIPSLACLGIVLASAPTSVAQDNFRAELAKYERYLSRPSLRKRTDGRIYFAQTKDLRAFDVLVRSYGKPESPRDHNKYLITTIAMDHFAETAPDEVLEKWRSKYRKPIDAWMWFETLRISRMRARRDQLLELASSKENQYVRGAAFAAVLDHLDTYSADEDLAGWCALQLTELPRKPIERAILLEGIAAVIVQKKRRVREAPWKEVCRTMMKAAFEDPTTPRRTKVVISRFLAETFNSMNLGFEFHHWNVELDRVPSAPKRSRSGNTTSVGFAGIRTKGDHIVYVIDASDSMLKKVTNLKKVDLGPTTGGKKKLEPKHGDGVVPTADDLDWSRIRTRFDAAREFLRISLGTLKEDQRFSVVLFGDEAIPLAATPSLVKATPKNIKRALRELYTLKEGPATTNRPDGQLRGKTNFHGGVRLAYRMTNKGITKKAEYADDKSMIEGCDTLFILSDGAPSTDDWLTPDDAEPKDKAGDPESGVPTKKTKQLIFDGPYGQQPNSFIAEDIERMNLLRRCEIHCVAIGEADTNFLGRIAKIGHGQSIRIDSRVKDGKKRRR